MVSRAQFLMGTALGVLAATAAPAQGAPLASRLLVATDEGIPVDSTRPINAAINRLIARLAEQGGGAIVFPPGVYPVDFEGIKMGHQVSLLGLGEATQFRPVGEWPELAGVFRTGTDKTPTKNPLYRTGLHNLSIKTGTDPFEHAQPIPNTVGILYNTHNGDNPPDPDAAHRISGITLWDLDMGIKLKGMDDQGCTVSEIRGRRFLRTGLTVGDTSLGAGADNFFSLIDMSSANRARVDAATIEVYASNCSFSQVKTWYSKRPTSFEESTKAGAGFYVAATRNTFTQCEAQDNGGHGFVVDLGSNTFVNCTADSNGHIDNVSGDASTGQAHGFHVGANATATQLIGCQSYNRFKQDPGQAVGFWIDAQNKDVTLIGSAHHNTQEPAVGARSGNNTTLVGASLDRQANR